MGGSRSGSGVRTARCVAAAAFVDTPAYITAVLEPGRPGPQAHAVPSDVWTVSGVGLGALSALLAVLVAGVALWGSRLPATVRRSVLPVRRAVDGLHAVHEGHLSNHVAWLVAGVAALGAALAW